MAEAVVSRAQLVRHVLAKQHLLPASPRAGLLEVADDLLGLHGTSAVTPYLSARARIPDFERTELDRALYEDRSLLRLKAMRGTVFVFSRALAPVAFAATAALTLARDRRWLKVDGSVYARLRGRIVRALAGRSLSTAELRRELGTDEDLSPTVMLLCDEGVLVRDRPAGSRRSSSFRYRVWDEALPDVDLRRYDQAEATRLLVGQYVQAYGPVTPSDIAWWSGLPVSRVRSALRQLGDEIVELEVLGLPGEFLAARTDLEVLSRRRRGPVPVVLLPELDPFTMGYRERARYLDPAWHEFVFDRGGNATSVVLIDGRVAGVWDLADAPEPVARVLLFDARNPRRNAVLAQAAAMGEFWFGAPVPAVEYASMTPLTERSGAMRKPLDAAEPRAE